MKLARSPLAPDHFPDLPVVKGVRAATASRGLYARAGLDRDDTMLFAFDEGTTCAGVFTRSATASDDVEWCRTALAEGQGRARALLVNAGNSNAFTGAFGRAKNAASLKALSDTFGVSEAACFLAATGVIGEPLPRADYIAELVPDLAARLGPPDWEACARAFMTTDTFPKGAGHFYRKVLNSRRSGQPRPTAVAVEPAPDWSIVGIAKGSGMIAPNMATMLTYIFTDLAIPQEQLDGLFRSMVNETFNAISVDGDTSTSDTAMIFATGASGIGIGDDKGIPGISDRGGDGTSMRFITLLKSVCRDLAEQIVRDGEGAGKLIRIHVKGAASREDARKVGRAVANSPLVKTALAAGDANWGRIVMAIGNSGAKVERDHLAIFFGDHLVAHGGARSEDYDEAIASAACAGDEIDITIHLGDLEGSSLTFLTCDLTHAYIDINGAYRT